MFHAGLLYGILKSISGASMKESKIMEIKETEAFWEGKKKPPGSGGFLVVRF
jgi:hypothetical protein